MSIPCTLYDPTGLFAYQMDMPDRESVDLNTPVGWVSVDGHQPENSYLKGEAVLIMPARPEGPFWRFDPSLEEWVDPRSAVQVAEELSRARRAAAFQINQHRGQVRMRFITSIAGQDMVYQEKERVARAWMSEYLAAGAEPDPADYPAIVAEVGPGLTGETAFQVAYIYIEMSEQWRALSPVIERVAIRYLNLAEAGADLLALEALPGQFLAEIDATLAAILGGAA